MQGSESTVRSTVSSFPPKFMAQSCSPLACAGNAAAVSVKSAERNDKITGFILEIRLFSS